MSQLHSQSSSRRSFLSNLGVIVVGSGCLEAKDHGPVSELSSFRDGSEIAVDVRKAKNSQELIGRPDLCSISEDLAWFVGVGEQLRIRRTADEYAVYTVDEIRVDPPATLRLSLAGRQRLGTSQMFAATLDTRVVASELSDADAMAASEFVERRGDNTDETSLVVLAPHGGAIEAETDVQASSLAAARGVGYWMCKGWRSGGGAYDRWHVTSTALHPASFPELAQIAGMGYARALAFHGMSSPGVIVGGAAPLADRQIIAQSIAWALAGTGLPVSAALPGDLHAGSSPGNLVNWLTGNGMNGIQIEQGPLVRSNHAQAVVTAVSLALDALV